MVQKFWQCRDRSIDLSSPKIMGIVNVTPDSFSVNIIPLHKR